MFKTFTFVKMQPGFTRDEFFERWCQHTRDFELRSHPELENNRLMLIEGDGPYVGIAEAHWESAGALDRAILWGETPTGLIHMKNLETFIDADNSPTFVVTHEANVSLAAGIEILQAPSIASSDDPKVAP